MCGITGIFLASNADNAASLNAIVDMTSRLHHRGPDADGFWRDPIAGVAFGHRRLAIVDLSDAGRQPMRSHSGRFVIAFNGEIYNFQSLRRELETHGLSFRGGSDTEVMLAAIERWGLDAALQRFTGMFAFALWDRETRELHLVRDRMGKKPLYIARVSNGLLFASELKAILAAPAFKSDVDQQTLSTMLEQSWVPDDMCIWRDAFKLPPGSRLALNAGDLASRPSVAALRARAVTWWSLADTATACHARQFTGDDRSLIDDLDQLLCLCVRERMVADVPLGAFLSGGIDSSTVVALMQAQSNRSVRTFTIAFGERGYDESSNARVVAQHLKTNHTELRVTPTEAREVIPELPQIWDEPFADESQIPSLLISRLARQDVTVALSGDGGDECFAGYLRHVLAAKLGSALGAPLWLRRKAGSALRLFANGVGVRLSEAPFLPDHSRRALTGDRLGRLARLLATNDEGDLYRCLIRASELPEPRSTRAVPVTPTLDSLPARLAYMDMEQYLVGDILVKLDRASMAASLEARCPILDHRVVEFALRLPTRMKIRNGGGKWILRQVLARYVPERLFERPKQGFDVPIGAWLRGPLREWANDLLASSMLRRHNLMDEKRIQTCLLEHQNGRRDHSRELWAALMAQAWLVEVGSKPIASSTKSQIELQGSY